MEDQIRQLQRDLDAARAMTLKMMAANSEMGQITHFLKRSFAANDFSTLAYDLLEHLASQELKASVSFADPTGRQFFTLNHDYDMLDEALISRHLSAGRLVEVGQRLIVNYEHCSLLVENVPDDVERKGELRDNLAILMDGVEARVQALAMMDRVEEAHRAKEAFFSLMSHELRTPLNPIIGYATRLHAKLSPEIEERDAKALSSIRDNGEHLLRQINDILEFLRVQSGSINLHPAQTNIRQLVLKALQELQSVIEAHDVNVTATELDENLIFYGDPARLLDVLVGLISNAVKYSPQGAVEISLSVVHHQDAEDNHLLIDVKDTGAGIPESQFERIFHHFTERDTPVSPCTTSPGVSLYLVRELVRLHGGEVQVSSIVGEGSQFRVTLPGVGVCIK